MVSIDRFESNLKGILHLKQPGVYRQTWELTHLRFEFLLKLLSGSMILLTITFELRMISQNIWRRVVGNVLINISPSNIFLTLLLPVWFYQICQSAFGRCDNELNWLQHEAHTSAAELGLMMKFQDCGPCISESPGNYGTWSRLVSYSRHLLFKRKCPIYRHLNLTLPMLRLLTSKAQGHKDFWKTSKPCHVGIHHIALAEYR